LAELFVLVFAFVPPTDAFTVPLLQRTKEARTNKNKLTEGRIKEKRKTHMKKKRIETE